MWAAPRKIKGRDWRRDHSAVPIASPRRLGGTSELLEIVIPGEATCETLAQKVFAGFRAGHWVPSSPLRCGRDDK